MTGTDAISYPSYTWTRPDAVLYPGGRRREYDYDPLMRITRILAKDPGKNILLDYSYTYDTMDNILSKQTEQGTYNYTYDARSRLTGVQVDIPGQENEGFSYDAVGNRLSEEGVEGEWTYNGNNELLTVATTEYTYDANGNARQLLLNGTVMFTYHHNAQDRLVKVDDVNGNTIAEYSYDPFGRRLWKKVSGTRTYFFYADEGLVAEYDASGTEIRAYGYRPDSTWTTDPLWLKQGGEYYFYQNDHLGTPQKLVKQNGAIAWSASYTAFGKASVEIETVTNNLRFPGQYFDTETGLHYNWYRYYMPFFGRYLTTDPLRMNAGLNYYRYVKNNPVVKFDSNGLTCVTIFSITLPQPAILEDSKLVNEGEWHFQIPPRPQLAINPGNGVWTLNKDPKSGILNIVLTISGLPPIAVAKNFMSNIGIAECYAIRKLVYEDTYIREYLHEEVALCCRECEGCSINRWRSKFFGKRWTKRRTEYDQDSAIFSIKGPYDILAYQVCTEWLKLLN